MKDLTKELQQMPEIKKDDVTSLYTADNIVGDEEGLDVTAFYTKIPTQHEDLEQLRQSVRGNEMAFERMVSRDETVTVLIAKSKMTSSRKNSITACSIWPKAMKGRRNCMWPERRLSRVQWRTSAPKTCSAWC